MTSKEIIDKLLITSKLLELHSKNPFKIKSYANAAYKLSKLRYDFEGKTKQDISSIEGIGNGISSKIIELITTNNISELQELLEITPQGVIQMLGIKGIGPKKVRQLWLELEIESIGELLYACNENRLVALKGFGFKTQLQIKQNIEFNILNSNKFHFALIDLSIKQLKKDILQFYPNLKIAEVGQLARKCEVIDKIEMLIGSIISIDFNHLQEKIPLPINYFFCAPEEFNYHFIKLSSTPEHLNKINFDSLKIKDFASQESLYQHLNLQYIEPELREGFNEVDLAKANKLPELIQLSDLKGILHNHTTYSDGIDSLKEMADYCKSLGYDYLGICDHSKSAFYAQGLSIESVILQQEEITKLNLSYDNFKILKGIESDILTDGELDYPEEILKSFDFIVASIHSNFKMNADKATDRLIKAIENPYTSILGHPTGRLLLSRNGYPIHHKKVIDACAKNNVSIELNSHPYRLDIDWRWIPYCIEKGVKIAINPDAHHKLGFHDLYYGICVARKGMLEKQNCLNAMSLTQLLNFFKK